MNDRLRVFVASSSEQIGIANRVADAIRAADQAAGQSLLDVCPWQEGVFSFSATYIESLEQELNLADFAIVVMTGDDVAHVREQEVNLPRDNVIFELGLFIGRLERNRCFFFIDGGSKTRIASDLSGVKSVEFFAGSDIEVAGNPALKDQVEKVREQMIKLGSRYKPSPKIRAGQEELWRFCRRLSGAWWERMRAGEDDMSALSYVTISVDEVTNTPRLEGRSYGLDGEPLAEWKSVVSGVELSATKPMLSYRWEGEYEESHGQRYGGGGRITFDDPTLNTGQGYFYDTNYALLASDPSTRIKRFGLYRCTPEEIDAMARHWTEEAKLLRRMKLSSLHGR
jgi:hypothetical protein